MTQMKQIMKATQCFHYPPTQAPVFVYVLSEVRMLRVHLMLPLNHKKILSITFDKSAAHIHYTILFVTQQLKRVMIIFL